jgi:two-component system, cell cycle sensor histidine kinase PleC
MVTVSVIDTGMGISPSNLERALQPFVQIEREKDRYHEGTGLGLALCKNFAELQGGNFILESEEGKGTRAAFTVPIWKTENAE